MRASKTIEAFEKTANESIAKLKAMPPTEESADLRREAVALRALFRSWNTRAPTLEERSAAIARLIGVHRAIEEYAAEHRSR